MWKMLNFACSEKNAVKAMRYYCSPMRLPKIQKLGNIPYGSGYDETGTFLHCHWQFGSENWYSPMENNFAGFRKITVPLTFRAVSLLGIYPGDTWKDFNKKSPSFLSEAAVQWPPPAEEHSRGLRAVIFANGVMNAGHLLILVQRHLEKVLQSAEILQDGEKCSISFIWAVGVYNTDSENRIINPILNAKV